ncbi:hypothetical protein V5030_15365 [Moellerella wisconsensis]|uniref:hypothetical protein n=1 Tax=Moellerella wisconsensis TaxID=158849 RepID=UPI00307629D7
MPYGLEVYKDGVTEFLTTMESFVFFEKLTLTQYRQRISTGIPSNLTPPMIFIKTDTVLNGTDAVPTGMPRVLNENGFWVLYWDKLEQNATPYHNLVFYLFVRMSEMPDAKLNKKWGCEIYQQGKLIQKSGANPLRIRYATGFNPGHDVMGKVIDVGVPCAVLMRVHSYYSIPAAGPLPAQVFEVSACGSDHKILPQRSMLSYGTTSNIINDNNIEYIDTRMYD